MGLWSDWLAMIMVIAHEGFVFESTCPFQTDLKDRKIPVHPNCHFLNFCHMGLLGEQQLLISL